MGNESAIESVRRLREGDAAAESLGIDVVEVADGRVVLALTIRDTMVNGHGIAHGAYVFAVADTAFAYCCAGAGRPSVTRNADVAFAAPAALGQRIVAVAALRSQFGRTTVCDVTVTGPDGSVLAEFRGFGALRD